MGEPSGTLKGKQRVGAYWRRALERIPDLHFEVLDVFPGVGSIVIYYKAVLGLLGLRGLLLRRAGQGLQSRRPLQPQPAIRSDGHRCLRVLGPFGLLAGRRPRFPANAPRVFALSTFDTDYLLR